MEVKTIKAMAEVLGVSRSTLVRWMREGMFPRGKKFGGSKSPVVWDTDNPKGLRREVTV